MTGQRKKLEIEYADAEVAYIELEAKTDIDFKEQQLALAKLKGYMDGLKFGMKWLT